MKTKPLIGIRVAALALLLASCGEGGNGDRNAAPLAPPAPAIPAPGNADWAQTVVETPQGGFRMGNPDAPVKLVEYASLSCPHCARFSKEATAALTELVRSGHLSWEFRQYQIFLTDPSASLVARCQGPASFFPVTEQLYARQDEWIEKVRALPSAELERIKSLPPQQQILAMINSAGLTPYLQSKVPQSQVQACLTDNVQLEKLAALTRLGKQEGVPGTPTFFINGKIVEDVGDWSALQPLIHDAFRR